MPQALRVIDLDDRICIFEPKEKLAPEERPQDPSLEGHGLTFQVLSYGGEYDDTHRKHVQSRHNLYSLAFQKLTIWLER